MLLWACGAGRTQPTVVIRPLPTCDVEIDRVARALCLVRRFVEEARKQRDVVKLVCLRDKEAQLEVLRETPGDAGRFAKADALEHESEQCIGELTLHR